jgi:hypothetical protein
VIKLVLAYAQLAAAVIEFLAICAAANLILKQHRCRPWMPSGRAVLMSKLFGVAVGWVARRALKRTP